MSPNDQLTILFAAAIGAAICIWAFFKMLWFTCDKCHGNGWVRIAVEPYTRWQACRICEGTGEVWK